MTLSWTELDITETFHLSIVWISSMTPTYGCNFSEYFLWPFLIHFSVCAHFGLLCLWFILRFSLLRCVNINDFLLNIINLLLVIKVDDFFTLFLKKGFDESFLNMNVSWILTVLTCSLSFFVGIIDISSLSFIGVFNTEPLVLEAACNFTFYLLDPTYCTAHY